MSEYETVSGSLATAPPAFLDSLRARRRPWLRRVTRRLRPGSGWVKRVTAAIWMNVLIVLVVLVTAATVRVAQDGSSPTVTGWHARALALFALWLLAFLPGWLYVRFLGLRAGALWNEYVLNLHRLGWDEGKYLPTAPRDSQFHDGRASQPDRQASADNIYRQKFDAYYGRRVSARGSAEDFTVNVETLFPVLLCTTMLAVGWAAVLWDPVRVIDPVGAWSALQFGFLGAYAFAVSMLVRRFYQSDLRPSAYASVVLRVVLVLVIVIVMHQFFGLAGVDGPAATRTEMITAFVVGFFPLVGLQALQRVTSKALHTVLPQLAPDYPLDLVDGLNVWYEARLAEEGVEDLQNLTTMNLVDVILHTRVPVGRLVDWVDQAFLILHLDRATREELDQARKQTPQEGTARGGAATRIALRRIGVRSATDLIKTFGSADDQGATGQPNAELRDAAAKAAGLDLVQIDFLVKLLAQEPGLNPVWNWMGGAPPRLQRLPPA